MRSAALGVGFGASLALRHLAGTLLAVLPIEVTTSEGDQVGGTYGGMEPEAVVVQGDGQPRRLAFDQIVSMAPQDVEARTGPAIRINLRGGSQIAAEQVSMDDEQLVIQPRRQQTLEVPLEQVASIRFRSASPATDAQWLGMLEEEGQGDLLAVRREQERLDQIRGVVDGIGDGVVKFSIAGDSVEAPIERLEGIVFAGGEEVSDAAEIQIEDVYGSRWAATELLASEADQPLRFRLGEETSHAVPLDQVASIRWSGGLLLLAGEQPAEQSYDPHLTPSIDSSLVQTWFGPQSDRDTDLILRAGSSVEYRIPEGFRTFSGTVRRAESVDQAGRVTVEIRLGDQTVWSETIGDDAARGFELSVAEAGRVAIEVGAGGDGDLGDTVRFSRPRLLK